MFLFQLIRVLLISITFYTYLANIVFSCDFYKLLLKFFCIRDYTGYTTSSQFTLLFITETENY